MRIIVLSFLLMVALSTVAAAPLTFEEVDADGDGLISADEAAIIDGLDFNAADGDNDGTLSIDEYDIAIETLHPSAVTPSPADPPLIVPLSPAAAPPAAPPAAPGSASPAPPATPPKP